MGTITVRHVQTYTQEDYSNAISREMALSLEIAGEHSLFNIEHDNLCSMEQFLQLYNCREHDICWLSYSLDPHIGHDLDGLIRLGVTCFHKWVPFWLKHQKGTWLDGALREYLKEHTEVVVKQHSGYATHNHTY